MANNRLYLVDTSTGEYLCLAKEWRGLWSAGNHDLYKKFINDRNVIDAKESLIIGTENSEEFYNKWIVSGVNYNSENKWD